MFDCRRWLIAMAIVVSGGLPLVGGATTAAAATCSGNADTIAGKGSSLQKEAQAVWTSAYSTACSNAPKAEYTSTGSGPGLEAFRFTGSGTINHAFQFIGTDDAPNGAQISHAEEATPESKGVPIIVPVSQTAIAVDVHLPEKCKFKTGKGITWANLTKIWGGKEITEWSQVTNTEATVTGGCAHKIIRVVRAEGSGTTFQFKNYLQVLVSEVEGNAPPCTTDGQTTWEGLEPITEAGTEKPNTAWPQCEGGTEIKTAAGGGALAEYVKNNVDTIGYSALPDTKAEGATPALMQNAKVAGEPKYAEAGKEETKEGLTYKTARCESARYSVPTAAQTEGSGAVSWTGVFGAKPKIGGSEYPLCTLTWDVGWKSYAEAGYETEAVSKGTTAAKWGTDVRNYINSYIVPSAEGQKAIREKWYSPMPTGSGASTDVQQAAEFAAKQIETGGGGGSPAEPTTLTTSLSGESKSGAEITVLEGSKVKDQATLEGKNAAKATGKISYAVYKDASCKELVTNAGESEFKEGKVPASEEKTLEAGKTYYWQAHYSGDSLNAESTSSCGGEVLKVKAATSVSTSLSGESKSGAEITVLEGVGVKDKATLSGTNSTTATGKVKFKIYKDSECKELAAETEGTLSGGSAESAEEKLTAGAVYYWVASYEGDSLHQASTSACGKEALTVKAATTLSTSLSGEEKSGGTITVNEGAKVKDKATLSGTNSAKATGIVTYRIYSDPECKKLVAGAGEVTVTAGSVPASEEVTLEGGKIYYWEAEYSGDTTHGVSVSSCGSEKLTVKAATSLSTNLIGANPESEEELLEGSEINLTEGFPVGDSATLSGTNSSTATGTIHFKLYSDKECKSLVEGAGEAAVEKGELTVRSEELELGAGTYYVQAEYEGDSLHQSSKSSCGSEVIKVKAPTAMTTSMKGGVVIESGEFGEFIEVEEGKEVSDTATLEGVNAATATGTVEYNIYSDAECSKLAKAAGKVTVSEGKVPGSEAVKTLKPGVYFFQARYSGDASNSPSLSECGTEIVLVEEGEGPPPEKKILHEENAAGAALAIGSKVVGTSPNILFITEGPWYSPIKWGIECTESKFEGQVFENKANRGTVNLEAWTLKKGGAVEKAERCRTGMEFAGEKVEAAMTVLDMGNLRVTRAEGATVGPFEVKEELFTPEIKEPLLTCRFGRQAVPALFEFRVPLGLRLAATVSNRLMRRPGNPWNCGTTLGMMGTVTVKTKLGEKAVVPV